MSGGDPPLPPSRPPYHSWHSRPSHRRRGGPPGGARNGWVGRRPRSPPLPPPRPRHLRPPYKHHRHVLHTSPSAPQSQHHSAGYHPHGPPLSLSRNLQGRLRSPPRSPLRHPDLAPHRVDSQPYRGEPGPSHRVEPPEHASFRGGDPLSFRGPPPKSRAESFPFAPERGSLRGPSDHPPYRGEPGPLYRTDSASHRDDFEPRRGLGGVGGAGGGDGLPNRPDPGSQYASWFRQPNKIHKPLKPKKRRPHPHMLNAMRASAPYLSKPQSPILSRIGLSTGDRGTAASRIGLGSTPGSVRKGQGSNLNSPKLFQELSSTSSRSNATDAHVFGAAKLRRSGSSPRQQQGMRLIPSPDERTNNDRQKSQSNGPIHVDFEKQEDRLPNGTDKRLEAHTERKKPQQELIKPEVVIDDAIACNGVDPSQANGPRDASVKKNYASDAQRRLPRPSGAAYSAEETDLRPREANGQKPDSLPKVVVQPLNKLSPTKHSSKAENGPRTTSKETIRSSQNSTESRLKPGSPHSQAPSSGAVDTKTPRSFSDPAQGKPVISRPRLSIPLFSKSLGEIVPYPPCTPKKSPGLHSEHAQPPLKPAAVFRSAPKFQNDTQSDPVRSSEQQKELSSAPPSLSIPQAPVPVPAPAMSLLRSTPRSRARSSSFEGKLGSLTSFGNLSSSPPQPSTGFLRGNVTKTGVASAHLVKQIHEVEGKITAIERTLADLKNDIPKKVVALGSPSHPPKEEGGDSYAAIAREIVATAEERVVAKPAKRSAEPLHAEARLLLVKNQALAAAAHAELRTLCSDVEWGLDGTAENANCLTRELSSEMRTRMTEHMKSERAADLEKRKRMTKDYVSLMESWRRRLKSARDKRSKEKREAIRERDRYILLCTKGTSALLTSRTSSGRTSTKIVPSVGANGQTNGTAELDQLLTDIETEGGTPGSRLIWGKTLAEIPDQDTSRYPKDCYSVLMNDPVAEHYASRAVNPWRFEEVLVFLDKYLTCSKNFIKISSFLEHKSPRDCSYFYYMNKLRLGLKQLTKEASAMKRKGSLQRHLFQIAKRFAFLSPSDDSKDSFIVPVQNAVSVSAAEKLLASSEVKMSSFPGVGSCRPICGTVRRNVREMPLKRSERILSDVRAVDLAGIERRSFAQAMVVHGTDWKAVASYLGIPGKSSTHYREFLRRNKRKLEAEDMREHSRARLLLPSRNPNSGSRYSPRMSPRSSPRHAAQGHRSKISDVLEAESPELIPLDGTDNEECATRDLLNDDKDTSERRAKEDSSRTKHEAEAPVRTKIKRERNVRKGKATATWTAEECVQFRVLFKQHGRDWKTMASLMAPKTPTQIKGYWRTVSHEVGDGLAVDGTRSSKLDRKRMKRRTSSETLSRHSPNASQSDLRTSPMVKSPKVKDDEEVVADRDGQDSRRRESQDQVGEKVNRDVAKGVRLKESLNSKQSDRGPQEGTPTEIATSEERAEVSKNRLPVLRSLPMPVLRSVPISSGKSNAESDKDTSNVISSSISIQASKGSCTRKRKTLQHEP